MHKENNARISKSGTIDSQARTPGSKKNKAVDEGIVLKYEIVGTYRNAVIKARSDASGRGRDRVICSSCGKAIIPRIITYRGSLDRSVCPFCGKTYKNFSACFIATAVYGDPHVAEVVALRRFRDDSLQRTRPGRLFIRAYYRFSPPIARYLSRHPALAGLVRRMLDKLVKLWI